MSMTAIIGALVALLPGANPSKTLARVDENLDQIEIDRLRNEINRLDRELAIQREMTDHWKKRAMQFAARSRSYRERFELARAHARELHAPAAQLQQYQLNAQLFAQQAQAQRAQLQQYAQIGSQLNFAQQAQALDVCHCVPGRAELFLQMQNSQLRP
jgi:DNA repair ATPase RecN